MSEDRKLCPKCGHSNRATAKNCTQCGYAFSQADGQAAAQPEEQLTVTEEIPVTDAVLRKRCPNCGHMNRMGAKTCSRCGTAFGGKIMVVREHKQMWCPNCGARRRDGSKVCSYCGYRFKTATAPVEPPVVQSGALGQPVITGSVITTPRPTAPVTEPPVVQSTALGEPVAAGGVISAARPPEPGKKPVEPPVVQSDELAEPVRMGSVITTPRPPDLSGEPAPYLSPDEVKRLRQVGEHRPGLFVRLYQVLREDKP